MREKVSRREYEKEFKIDKKKAERHLNKFLKNRLVKRRGSGPSTHTMKLSRHKSRHSVAIENHKVVVLKIATLIATLCRDKTRT